MFRVIRFIRKWLPPTSNSGSERAAVVNEIGGFVFSDSESAEQSSDAIADDRIGESFVNHEGFPSVGVPKSK